MSDLKWLLSPITPADFFARHYESEPLLIRRDDDGYFAGLPDLESVDSLLATTVSNRRQPGDGERIVRSEPGGILTEKAVHVTPSMAVDIQSVYRQYHEGFTVVVNHMHRRSASVGRLCRGLQAALHHQVGANLYLTPAEAQGFLPHIDTHDVFVLQLHGTKEWHVSEPTVELPLADHRHDRRPLANPRTFVLAPGDMLYLPRGFRHEGVTGKSSSLHLTVGVYAYRWHDLFTEVLDMLADRDVALRGSLPARFLDEPSDLNHAAPMVSRLAEALLDSGTIEKAKQRIGSRLLLTDAAAGQSRFRSLDALAQLTEKSTVARPPELLCLLTSTSEGVTLEFAGNFVSGPRYLEPAFAFIRANERFSISQLPGALSSDDRVELVKRLVSEGLLEVLLP